MDPLFALGWTTAMFAFAAIVINITFFLYLRDRRIEKKHLEQRNHDTAPDRLRDHDEDTDKLRDRVRELESQLDAAHGDLLKLRREHVQLQSELLAHLRKTTRASLRNKSPVSTMIRAGEREVQWNKP